MKLFRHAVGRIIITQAGQEVPPDEIDYALTTESSIVMITQNGAVLVSEEFGENDIQTETSLPIQDQDGIALKVE